MIPNKKYFLLRQCFNFPGSKKVYYKLTQDDKSNQCHRVNKKLSSYAKLSSFHTHENVTNCLTEWHVESLTKTLS